MRLTKEYITTKYPEMFTDCFDFSVGDGWLPLVLEFCISFPDAKIHQIKEKFSTLRLYAEPVSYSPAFTELIHTLENLSGRICEDCGKPAEYTTNGWLRKVCQECSAPYPTKSEIYK